MNEDERAQAVTVFRNHGEWCYALWLEAEWDHGDTLAIPAEATERDAFTVAGILFPGAEISRVDDTSEM